MGRLCPYFSGAAAAWTVTEAGAKAPSPRSGILYPRPESRRRCNHLSAALRHRSQEIQLPVTFAFVKHNATHNETLTLPGAKRRAAPSPAQAGEGLKSRRYFAPVGSQYFFETSKTSCVQAPSGFLVMTGADFAESRIDTVRS